MRGRKEFELELIGSLKNDHIKQHIMQVES